MSLAGAQSISEVDYTQGIQLKSTALSFGGAYRAIADNNTAILLNPAGLGFFDEKVSLAADYTRVGRTASNAISISAVDARALPGIPFALSYDRDQPTLSGTAQINLNQISAASAMRLGSMMSAGLTFKGYFTSTNSPLVSGPDGVDLDLGFMLRPASFLSFALTAQNVFNGGHFEEFPLVIGFGSALFLDPHAKLSIDITRDFQTPANGKVNSHFGGELRMAEGIFLRGGFGIDQVRQNNFYAIGIALAGPKINLHFTFSQRLNPSSNTFATGLEFYL
ncbi:MAG: hypothetical protein KDD48_05785 [Bdellovibrionales bacterium]|nr:hypothetical protein [Bdellovibrionales bacterium]